MIVQWFVGFHSRYARSASGSLTFTGLWGHCEIWGYTIDDTWVFIDPQGMKGTSTYVTHLYDEVLAQIEARFALCETILTVPAPQNVNFFPAFPPMTCASIAGHFLGVRAFTPSGLKRKLLRNGAEIVHEAEGRPKGSGRSRAPAANC